MRREINLFLASLAAAALVGCGGTDSSSANAPGADESRLEAIAVLQPGETELEDYVEWAVFPGYVPEDGGPPVFSDSGTPYDVAELDIALAPGHYRVEAEAGQLESSVDIEIAEGEAAQIRVPLEGALLAIDPVSDTGVSGRLVRPNGRTTGFGSSAGAHILSVEPGRHEISLNRGETRTSRSVDIAPGTLTVLEPDLSVGTLKGAFDFAGAEPDFGLEWSIREWNSEEEKVGEQVARELGATFEVQLPPGEYWVRGVASGLLRGSETVMVRAFETTDFTLSIPFTRLTAQLIDSEGSEITEGFYWWLLDADNLDDKPWEVKKPGEAFLMAIRDDITYVLAARDNESGEFVAMSEPLDLQAGQPLELELDRE